MIIDTYDLTSKMQLSRYKDKSNRDVSILKPPIPLRDLLIEPIDKQRPPYLQDYNNPCIEDFYKDGTYKYDKSFFVSGILRDLNQNSDKSKEALSRLNAYFSYQLGILTQDKMPPDIPIVGKGDLNILAVPDDYTDITQTQILHQCQLPKSQTFLLWRSVAACLGAEEELKEQGARDGDIVAILDFQKYSANLSFLTLRQDNDFLIPQRKCYREKSNFYPSPIELNDNGHKKHSNSIALDFYRHTYGDQKNQAIVYTGDKDLAWSKENFEESYSPSILLKKQSIDKAKFIIILGINDVKIHQDCPMIHQIRETFPSQDFVSLGCARFAVRKQNSLPTYFDQCERLSLIVQNKSEETIGSKTLIEPNEFCKGGEEIIGKTNSDCSIEACNSHAEFYLYLGELTDTSTLKLLKQDFKVEATSSQRLILVPKMIPGQGIAQVEVQGQPLLKDSVQLNLLEMKDSQESINSLSQKMKRSFPLDMPGVEADPIAWRNIEQDVSNYCNTGEIDNDIFCKSRWIHLDSLKIDRFERSNVFGTKPGKNIPICDPLIMDTLFKKLSADYCRYKKNGNDKNLGKIIRIVAWTYQSNNKYFANILEDTLFRIESGDNLWLQEYTLCANLLFKPKHQKQFFLAFCKQAKERIRTSPNNPITKMDHWLRSLSEMLMFNNIMLKEINTNDCLECTMHLISILDNYIWHDKTEQYVRYILKCLLFLLKRRKYDKNFLQNNNEDSNKIIRDKLSRVLHDLQNKYSSTNNLHSLAQCVLDFLKGEGTLEGIPVGD